ncbi:MAG: hypothetical protein ACJARD_001346 [Alphaproteobacteria bacterium]|jgi:hypothetical protein
MDSVNEINAVYLDTTFGDTDNQFNSQEDVKKFLEAWGYEEATVKYENNKLSIDLDGAGEAFEEQIFNNITELNAENFISIFDQEPKNGSISAFEFNDVFSISTDSSDLQWPENSDFGQGDDINSVESEFVAAVRNTDGIYNFLNPVLGQLTDAQLQDLAHDIYKSKGTLSFNDAMQKFIQKISGSDGVFQLNDLINAQSNGQNLLRKKASDIGKHRRDIFDRNVISDIINDSQVSSLSNGSGNTQSQNSDTNMDEEDANNNPNSGTKSRRIANPDNEDPIPPAPAPALADQNPPSAPPVEAGSNTRFNVSRGNKSAWHTETFPQGNVEMQYESLERPYRGPVATDGADYIMIIKSGGRVHNKINNPQDYFGTNDGEMIGYSGDKDKGMMLIKVSDLDKINMETGNSSVQIIRIKTDQELTFLNNGGQAIDDELLDTRTSNGDQTAQRAAGGTIAHRRVNAFNQGNSFFTIYADDESQEEDNPDRVRKYSDASRMTYYGGDDSSYLMAPGAQADPKGKGSGNGAIGHLGFK